MTTEFRYGPQPPHRTDPEYISAIEHFESMPHEQIYAGTQRIDAGEILQTSLVWLEAAGTLATSMPITRDTAGRVMDSVRWTGVAADAASACTRSFAESVDELAAVLGEVGARLGALAAAAEAVKVAVVPSGDSGPVGTVARLLEAAHVIGAQQAQEALRQEAVLAMNMIYKPAYSAAGSGIPALPEPPAVPGLPSAPAPLRSNPPAPRSVPPQPQSVPPQPQSVPPQPQSVPPRQQTPPAPATPAPPAAPTPENTTPATPSPSPAPSTQHPAPPSTAARGAASTVQGWGKGLRAWCFRASGPPEVRVWRGAGGAAAAAEPTVAAGEPTAARVDSSAAARGRSAGRARREAPAGPECRCPQRNTPVCRSCSWPAPPPAAVPPAPAARR
ncbi:hypothetical protein [Nocardia terpenica]|uniref:hypothetical protein n=1 Tax=Nocardia terpenica TaxID=455432 RepID=UPI000A45839A|nr:hypothetical protein [Nocardia terpenica]